MNLNIDGIGQIWWTKASHSKQNLSFSGFVLYGLFSWHNTSDQMIAELIAKYIFDLCKQTRRNFEFHLRLHHVWAKSR